MSEVAFFPARYPFLPRLYRVTRAPLSAYLHFPYCARKCAYCDFVSFGEGDRRRSPLPPERYADVLIEEIAQTARRRRDAGLPTAALETVYFGGGTPTLLPPSDLARILEALERFFGLVSEAEITIEMNPERSCRALLFDLRTAGFSRLSVGLQAAQDRLLRFLGRKHSCADFCRSIEAARRAGFENISADLMAALPGQRFHDLRASAQVLLDLDIEHVSVYSLILEEGSLFYELHRRGRLELPSEREERELVHFVTDFLERGGHRLYEVSNFARPGKASRHNAAYWLAEAYYAFGLAAASYVDGERRRRTADPATYLQEIASGMPAQLEEKQEDLEGARRDYLCFAPRLVRPFGGKDFFLRFGEELPPEDARRCEELVGRGLLRVSEEREGERLWRAYCLRREALDYADEVSRSLL